MNETKKKSVCIQTHTYDTIRIGVKQFAEFAALRSKG